MCHANRSDDFRGLCRYCGDNKLFFACRRPDSALISHQSGDSTRRINPIEQYDDGNVGISTGKNAFCQGTRKECLHNVLYGLIIMEEYTDWMQK